MNKKDIIEKIKKTDVALAGILTIACEDYHKKQGGDIYAWGYIRACAVHLSAWALSQPKKRWFCSGRCNHGKVS